MPTSTGWCETGTRGVGAGWPGVASPRELASSFQEVLRGGPRAASDTIARFLRHLAEKARGSAAFLYRWDAEVNELLPVRVEAPGGDAAGHQRLARSLALRAVRGRTRLRLEDPAELHGLATRAQVSPIEATPETFLGVVGVIGGDVGVDDLEIMEVAASFLLTALGAGLREREVGRQNVDLTRVRARLEETLGELERRQGVIESLNQEYRQTRDFLEQLIETAGDAIVILDAKGAVTGWNRAASRTFGYGREEMIGNDIALLQPPELADEGHRLAERIAAGETVNDLETVRLARDGRRLLVSITASPIHGEGGRIVGLFGILRDVGERRQLEAQLLRSEKLASLGQLVSGVAHEINNPLTGVVGFAQLLAERTTDPKTRSTLEKILAEGRRAGRIVKNLLAFARKGPAERREVDLRELLGRVLELREYQQHLGGIQLSCELGDEPIIVLGDASQLEQVFMNVTLNAEQALLSGSGGRHLSVRSRIVHGMVLVDIEDDGPGIPADVLSRVFDPFFTTKAPGMGTGLGLSIVHSIVASHGGRICVESEPGARTTFRMQFPRAPEGTSHGSGWRSDLVRGEDRGLTRSPSTTSTTE